MQQDQYNRMADALRSHPKALGWILGANRLITGLTMAAYPALLLYLLFTAKYEMLYHTVLVPGVAFVVVSLFRRVYNAPRPYEKMDIRPLIPKDTHGRSFPSRHVFSIFIIGMCFTQVSPILAGLIFLAGIFLAIVRVIGGVHFIGDVIAGALLGIFIGILGFYFIF